MGWRICWAGSTRSCGDGATIFARVSKATFGYLDAFTWHRVTPMDPQTTPGITWRDLYRRFLTGRPGNQPEVDGITMFDTATIPITRYRWRASNIPTPWANAA